MDLTAPSTLLHAWLLAPGLLVVAMAGLGLAVSRLSGLALGALTLPAGFAAGAALMSFSFGVGLGAGLTCAICALLALAGLLAAAWQVRRAGADRAPVAAWAWSGLALLAAYGLAMAPLAGSGRAGVLGYVLNNDPAVHMSVVELLRDQGASTVDPGSGSYAFISTLFEGGYPLGSHVWVLFTSFFAAIDPFLIWTPVIAVGLALIALVVYELLRDLGLPRPAAAVAATVIGCGYLPYSYAAQGGAKEVYAALAVYATVALAMRAVRAGLTPRSLIPAGLGVAAGIAVFGLAIVPWLGTAAAIIAVVVLWRASGRAERLGRLRALGIGGVVGAVLALPSVLSSIEFARRSGAAIENQAQTGNLLGPVPWVEAFNVWLASDYRYPVPEERILTYAVLALVVPLAALGLVHALRLRRFALPLALVCAVVGAVYVSRRFAIYFDAKTYMLLAPALGVATAAGAYALVRLAARRRLLRRAALGVAGVLVVAALASNAFVYAGAWVTPKERFEELASIAERVGSRGPLLVAEREEYARYFLRDANPWDDWGEWQPQRYFRFGPVPPPPPRGPDLDDYTHEHIQRFALLLERKRPGGSRAPGNYVVDFETPSYRIWRRVAAKPRIHVSLGTEQLDGMSPLDCAQPDAVALMNTAQSERAELLISRGDGPLVVSSPRHWQLYGETPPGPARDTVLRRGGFAVAQPDLAPGVYDVWAQGSFGPGFRLSVGRRGLPDVVGDLGLHSGWRLVGSRVRITEADPAVVLVGLSKPWWQSGARRLDLHGPLAFAGSDAGDQVERVPATRARALCGENLDWVELP